MRVLAVRPPRRSIVSAETIALAKSCDYLGDLRPGQVVALLLWWMRRRPRRLARASRLGLADAPSSRDRARLIYHVMLALQAARTRDLGDTGILHVHFAGAAADVALALSRLLDLPLSIVAHAAELYAGANALPEKLRESAVFITISEYNRRALLERYGSLAEKVKVVHCGVEVRRCTGSGHAKAGDDPRVKADGHQPASDTPPAIVAVGRLSPKKGHNTLIKACGHLRDGSMPFRCQIVGGGELQEELQTLITSLNLEDRVELLGPQDHVDTMQVIADADITALACRVAADGDRDGIPVSLMEAMALGLPAVSTRVSGIPELIHDGENGILVPPDDPAAFADALAKLLEDGDLRRTYGLAAKATVEREFELRRCAAATRHLLQEAVPDLAPSSP